MDEKLKSCPFCGAEMIEAEFGFDHPNDDGCIIGYGSFAHDYRAAWNTRSPSDRNDVIGECAKICDAIVADQDVPDGAQTGAWNLAIAIRARKD